MVCKELRINDITGALGSRELENMTKVVDSVFLKYDHLKNGSLQVGELAGILKDIYKEGLIGT